MSSFKQLNQADVFCVPIKTHKPFNLYFDSKPDSGDVIIYNGDPGNFNINSSVTTSLGEYAVLVYNSINHQFYGEYSGSFLNTHSLMMTLNNYQSASSQRQTSSYFIINENIEYIHGLIQIEP